MSLDDAIRTAVDEAAAIEDPTERYTALTDLAVRFRDASDDAVAAATPPAAETSSSDDE